MFSFSDQRFTDVADLFLAVDMWQETTIVRPLIHKSRSLLDRCNRLWCELWESFHDGTPGPVNHSRSSRTGVEDLSLLSTKKNIHACARRYAFGSQVRGLHFNITNTSSMEDHVRKATQATHPVQNLDQNLDPAWRRVFDHWENSFRRHGARQTFRRIRQFRADACDMIRTMATDTEELRQEYIRNMSPSVTIVAGHLNLPLFLHSPFYYPFSESSISVPPTRRCSPGG